MPLPSWWNDVKGPMAARRVDMIWWLPIMIAESNGNPRASNTKGPDDSWGLFQLNRKGGQGAGYSPEQLMNPRINAEIAARYIAGGMDACQRDKDFTMSCVATRSGHPGPVPYNDKRVLTILKIRNAIAGANSEEDAWNKAREAMGGSGDLPDPEDGSGGSGGVNAIADDIAAFFSAHWPDPRDFAWSVVFGLTGGLLVAAGLFGLASATGVTKVVTKVVGAVPNPVAQGAAAAADVASQPFTAGSGGVPSVVVVKGQGATRPT